MSQGTHDRGRKLAVLCLVTAVVFSILIPTVFTGAAAAGNTSSNVEITNIRNGTDTMSVTVTATSTTELRNFTFWYDDLEGTSLGPTNISNSTTFDFAYYNNDSFTPFQRGDPLASDIGGGKVTFVFNSTRTEYDYESDPFRVNLTANKEAYATADAANRSVYTGSFYRIEADDHNGNELTNIPVLLYDAKTNASLGFAFMRSNNVTYDCRGVAVDGTCTNPDTGANAALTSLYGNVKGPIAVKAFSLSKANASENVEPGVGTTTLNVDVPTAPTFMSWRSAGPGATPNVDNLTIVNTASGNVVWQSSRVGSETRAPVLLKTNTQYKVSLVNKSSFGTENRTILIATKGMSGVEFKIDTSGLSTSTITGQVVNESGSPVENAIVIAQPEFSSGSRLSIYNSTTTDSNGVFTMSVPQTDEIRSDYGFRLIGTDTSGGTLIYYPTIDANGGDGYVAPSSRTVIPPMTIREGGRVDITVTSGGPSLPVGAAFTSLSQESTAYPTTERTALSNGYSTFAFGRNVPSSASVALMSPTTGPNTQVFYNVWGAGRPTQYLCVNQVSVSQGTATSSTCKLERAGYLNVSLEQYGSIVQQSSSSFADVESSLFFFENELVVRNASTGAVVTHLGPDGTQQFLLSGDSNSKDLSIPLPAGDYEVALRPASEWVDRTSVNDTSTVTVTAGSTTDLRLDRGNDFIVEPVADRFDTSLQRTGGNTLAVRVYDPATRSPLTNTNVSVSVQLLHLNGTVASEPQTLSYNSTAKSFETTSFDPSALGVSAGRYELALTATHASGSRTYSTTVSRPAQVTGFDTALNLGSVSLGPGNTLKGQISAYSGGSGIDASASNIDILLYNENGQVVKRTHPSSGISSGTGSFSVTMPDTVGQYQVAVRIESNSGKQGIALRWVRVSQIDLEVSTDKGTYAPSDTVTVTVEASNATDGTPITGATVVLRVNNNRVTATTDSTGRATVKLDPGTYASGPQWQRGHGVSVTLAHETATGVVRKTSGTFFEVRTFSASAEPTEEGFSPSESSVIRVTVPSSLTVRNITVTELDGEQVSITGDKVTKVADGVYTVDLGPRAVGPHLATARILTKNSGSETVTTPFVVQDYSVSATLNSRTVDAGENVSVTVAVRHPDNGTAVSGQTVSANLNATSPVRQVDSASATTGSNGQATLTLSSSVGGVHYVEVSVGEQTRRLGLVVSSVDARFEDASGNPVTSYQANPGTSKTIYINATKGGSPVADGSTVRAAVVTREGAVTLGSATTSGGVASITFTVPSSVPAGEYTLVARATAGSSSGIARGTLNVTGSAAKRIRATTNRSQLSPGDTVEFSATVTKGDGTPIANEPVDFVIQTRGAADTRVATVTTGSDGVATYAYTVPPGASDGEYVLKAELNNSQSIAAFSGYRVRSIDVEVQAEDGPFNPGDSVDLTVYANDSATGSSVSATGGTVTLVLPGSNVETALSPSGSAPYTVTVTLPDDSSIVGSRSITAVVQKDRQSDSDSTVIDVRDASEDANLSISRPVTAGTATTVTINGTVDETGVLTAYSPGTGTVAFNTSVTVSSSSNTTTSMTLDSPGTYVVTLSVPSVGEVTQVIDVQSASGTPKVWAGTAVNSTAETFTTSEDIYIQTNQSGLTATVLTKNASYTVPLDKQSGGTHYGVLSTNRPAGIYVVRLDSSSATNVNSTIIEVKR